MACGGRRRKGKEKIKKNYFFKDTKMKKIYTNKKITTALEHIFIGISTVAATVVSLSIFVNAYLEHYGDIW